jgi:ribosomal protein S18 acetylase RimI-like enzyme
MNLQRRAATESDVGYLMALRKEAMGGHLRNAGAPTSEEEHFARLMYGFEYAQVLEISGAPVGLLKLAMQPPAWELIQLQFEGQYRGSGLGTELLARLTEEAAEAGCDMKLSVLKANPARSLYERLGFKVIGEDEHEYHMYRSAA